VTIQPPPTIFTHNFTILDPGRVIVISDQSRLALPYQYSEIRPSFGYPISISDLAMTTRYRVECKPPVVETHSGDMMEGGHIPN
jgi:hypothetical protein